MKLLYLKSTWNSDSFDASFSIKIPLLRVLFTIEPYYSLLPRSVWWNNQTMEQFLAETKLRLDSDISHKIVEKLTDNRSILRQASQTITSKINDDILLEYNPKFRSIKTSFKSLMTEIENLEEQIERLELKLDGYDQKALLDSLVIQGIKQKPWVSLNTTLLGEFDQNIGGNISETDSTYQFRMNNTSQSQNSFGKVPLVFVKITSQDLAYKIGDPSAWKIRSIVDCVSSFNFFFFFFSVCLSLVIFYSSKKKTLFF